MHDAYSMKKRPSPLVYVNYHRLSLLYTAILKWPNEFECSKTVHPFPCLVCSLVACFYLWCLAQTKSGNRWREPPQCTMKYLLEPRKPTHKFYGPYPWTRILTHAKTLLVKIMQVQLLVYMHVIMTVVTRSGLWRKPKNNFVTMICVSGHVGHQKRALWLSWVPVPTNQPDGTMSESILKLKIIIIFVLTHVTRAVSCLRHVIIRFIRRLSLNSRT